MIVFVYEFLYKAEIKMQVVIKQAVKNEVLKKFIRQ